MIVKRFYEDKLAHASFLIGCAATGEAIVIDPNRDVDLYLREAGKEGLKITAVTETHIHADFLSGSRELAHRSGAKLYLSDEGDADWKYAYASEPNVVLVRDGDRIPVGRVRLEVVATPGHTPEHIAFVLTDVPASPEPLAAFTGDFIFVGDVGRPDLLERAAGIQGTMETGARTLFDSLSRFKARLPDSLLVWPAHGAGSSCGKSLGGVPVSTLGYERKANWALRCDDSGEFVRTVLAGQPDPPSYFKEMKRLNKLGPALLGEFKMPPRLDPGQLRDLVDRSETVVDVRKAEAFAAGFVPGVINIPGNRLFTNWAGWLIPYDRPIYLAASSEPQAEEAVRDLQKIGLDNVLGWFGQEALDSQPDLATLPPISALEAVDRFKRQELSIVDVRGLGEYAEGHIPDVPNVPLGHLESLLHRLPKDKPIVVHCQGGARSPIGASILVKHGFSKVFDLTGGFMEYLEAGLPVDFASAGRTVCESSVQGQ